MPRRGWQPLREWQNHVDPVVMGLRAHGRGLAPVAVVLALLLGLLVPLAPALVDLPLSLSLGAAVLVLVASLRAERPRELVEFPAVVLVLTLARLVLNVSTTRLILAEGDAGRVVAAFAELVVRGDLVIGAVVFVIVTAIQYLVIARGAERVAEVAARFALDGLPGQQLAIDGALRAGALGPREAEARRASLTARSDLYGRMDGVMRWVKGDATVGVLITATNLLGGLAVGVGRERLGVGPSLARYGTLAIGDGLLAQIPALLIALASALVVARGERETVQVAAIWLEPATLLAPAALLFLLALVPGMPTLAFASTAAGFALLAVHRLRRHPPALRSLPLRVRVGSGVAPPTRSTLAAVRRRCSDRSGLAIPELVLEPTPAKLAARELELRLGSRVLGRIRVDEGSDDALLVAVHQLVMDRAATFVTLAEIEAELGCWRERQVALLRRATRAVEPIDLLAIMRGFVRERLPAPRMDVLLPALAEGQVFGDLAERRRRPEHAREALAEHWVRDLCDRVAELGRPCWLRPTADLEETIAAGAVATDTGVRLRLSSHAREQLEGQIRALAGSRPAILVCSSGARAALASALGSTPRMSRCWRWPS